MRRRKIYVVFIQPLLNYIICSIVILLGIFVHYILPQLRKQLPWLLFSEPLIKQADYSLFEPTGKLSILEISLEIRFQRQQKFFLSKNFSFGLYFSKRTYFYHVHILVLSHNRHQQSSTNLVYCKFLFSILLFSILNNNNFQASNINFNLMFDKNASNWLL